MGCPYNSECICEVMEEIQGVLLQTSPYSEAFKHMHAVELEEQRHAGSSNTESQQVCLYFKRGPDCRRYNEPRHDEVAAVFIGEES